MMKWLKLLLSLKQMQTWSGIGSYVKNWGSRNWLWVLGIVILYGCLVAVQQCVDMRRVQINSKNIKLRRQDVRRAEYLEADILEALKKVKDNETVIIERNRDEKTRIIFIPDDSLQAWADSLYNARR